MTLASPPLRVCHYYARAFERRSGVTGAIAAWAAAQSAAGDLATVLGAEARCPQPESYPEGVEARAITHLGRGRRSWVPRRLEDHLRGQDVLVLHEGWTPSTTVAAAAARRADLPYLVVPHGVYEPDWVRLLRAPSVRSFAERRVLRGAAAVHLFFDSEAPAIRDLAPDTPLLIAPTGYDLPQHTWSGGGEALLWIGRYSIQHKGLDLLVHALALLPTASRPKLMMRGEDELDERQRVEELVERSGLRDWVDVGGPVYGEEKTDLLLSCAGYVQPSRWECHSLGLLEALAHGVPTLVSSEMHVAPALAACGAAVVVSLELPELAEGLVTLAAGAPATGHAGRIYVAERLNWDVVIGHYQREVRALLATGQPASSGDDERRRVSDAHR